MLKLYPPKGSRKTYIIRGSHFGVSGIWRNTETSDERLAKKVLSQLKLEIESGRFAIASGPVFDEAVLNYIKLGGEQRFILAIAKAWKGKLISEINQMEIDKLAISLYPNATPATLSRQVYTPVQAILRQAGVNIILKRPKGSTGNKREFFFKPEEAAKLINGAYGVDAEFGLFLEYLLYTGLRLSEGLTLRCEDLDLSRSEAFIGKTKNGLPRRVYIPTSLVASMANHPRGLERQGKVFRFLKSGRLYKLLNAAETASGVTIPDGVSFHAFRHTFAAYLRRYGGLDTSGLVATGAWASHDAARRYEHVDVDEASRASEHFPKLGAK